MKKIKNKKTLIFFIIICTLTIIVGWGIKEKLENFFYAWLIARKPFILVEIFPDSSEINERFALNSQLQSKAALSVLVDLEGRERFFFKRQENEKFPIASLTKLMTALIVLDNYKLSDKIKITEAVVKQEGEAGQLKPDEILSVKDLLYITLIESSNDAAYALTLPMGEEKFVDLMNLKAQNLGLNNTYFTNSTGLDSSDSLGPSNYSTAKELVKLTKYLIFNKPEMFEILSKKEYNLYLENNVFHHRLVNTNKLLEESAPPVGGWQTKIMGGKTGYTEKAEDCLVLVLKCKDNYLVNVILGAQNKFEEMKKILNYVENKCN